ncbi:bifunctional helix-turn-helix transcriptional regulator/GNAT family N-acetyltransferase [Zobellella maritima]|uniref:bifunctional helix-turn-helix transcriptional regulator/GNAT family N-acetyltransferase n=1 Tax=Zobellella maritima TaxID=2059725 RepID=UPI000E306FFD|nr:bifunctional helix-turn-helix transcriptional regulator/GNAT family N-acetyltransferase [Zobellella maritima]
MDQISALRSHSRTLVRELGMLDQHCGRVDLSPVQAHLLIELDKGPLNINQLAERLRVDKSNASRPLARLAKLGLVDYLDNPDDGRSKLVRLTSPGRQKLAALHREMNDYVARALAQLSPREQDIVSQGLALYGRALTRSRQQQNLLITPLQAEHNAALAALIRAVSAEYGLTADRGFSVADPQLDNLFDFYQGKGKGYWVVKDEEGRLLGGTGIGPVAASADTCELQKMYLAANGRGLGLGKRLALHALTRAREMGYRRCYLETTACLGEALALYRGLGFRPCPRLGNSGHHDCEITLGLELTDTAG